MVPHVREITINNYRSIGTARVKLGPFAAIVGANGAGKSNFVDAFAFVRDCLSGTIEMAFKNRGGIGAVRRRSGGHPTNIGIRLSMVLDEGVQADYSFEIAAKSRERFSVAKERCVIHTFFGRPFSGEDRSFEVAEGEFVKEIPGMRPRVASDRLALYAASGTEEFRPVYDFLTAMRCYSIIPERLRELQEADTGDELKRDGSNAAAVLKRLREMGGQADHYGRLCRLLSHVVGGLERVEHRAVGSKETLQFKQDVGQKHPWTFDALNMSDGTLRVLGLLLAVYQPGRSSIVAVEEPEATVHPGVAELITEVLLDASTERQVLITTHSPDILDYKGLSDDQIRVVTMERGNTFIAPLSESSRQAIHERLYSPGELLRSDELNPDLDAARESSRHADVFGPPSFDENHET